MSPRSTAEITPIEPEHFPWFPYRGFTFCLGLQRGDEAQQEAWLSGHTAAALDQALGKMTVSGTMVEQATIAYRKVMTVMEAAQMGPGDVIRVTENVTLSGLPFYDDLAAVRTEVFGTHQPVVTTVVLDRLVRGAAFVEIELHASRAGGQELLTSSEVGSLGGGWTPSPVRESHSETVNLPTIIPVENGEVVHEGDFVGQYAWCLDRADVLLAKTGLSLANAVTTYDYSTPATRDDYRRTHRVRKERLGGNGVYPGAGGILMSRLHAPGVLVALDVTASRLPLTAVNPGWSRYDTLTYTPGVRAGDTLFMSGFASLDMDTQQVLHPGELGKQAEVTYQAVLDVLAAAGTGPEHLVQTLEFCTLAGLPTYREVAAVRKRMLAPPWPASTGGICADLLRSEFMLEVFPTAVIPLAAEPSAPDAPGDA